MTIRPGKKTKQWQKIKVQLKKLFEEKGITSCEVRLEGCRNFFLTWAHLHKRHWYLGENEILLGDFSQVLLCCVDCHQKLERDPKLTQEMFAKLR